MEKFDWKKYIGECLESTKYCALATNDPEGVWVNPVYFAYDSSYNFYFISQLESRHMKNIAKNAQVSVGIYSTQQTGGDVVGIQLIGEAHALGNEADIQKAYEVYYGRKNPETKRDLEKSESDFMGSSAWHLVQIVPAKMYYFDTRFFEEVRQQVPLPL
ncbi:MAG TPA: pyridoxamine 5'-phosphate oxidase family protein [Candidatus Paceibacterota bacterium]|nr:pyridoxamine 5'-phosphate oxidase family protein [Candidatus Paceibacterota bacterium]